METKKVWISYLRITAMLAVVWMHTNGTIWGNQDIFSLTDFQIHFFAINYYLMMWAVPSFLMISGVLLLAPEKEITYSIVFNKYVKRLVIALAIFGTGYAAIMVVSSEGINKWIMFKAILGMLTGKTFSHLWYCYALIGIYLILPVLKSFVVRASNQDMICILVILFVTCFVLPWIGNIFGVTFAFNVPITYIVFYLIYGFYLSSRNSEKNILISIMGIMCIIAVCILAYRNPVLGYDILGYDSPITVMIVTMLFLVFKQNSTSLVVSKKAWTLDRMCFGIYLIHPFFIQCFYRIVGITPLTFGNCIIGTIIMFCIVMILSFISVYFMSLIPFMKKYVL